MLKRCGESGDETETLQAPSLPAVKGFDGRTTASGGRPESVSRSFGVALPYRRAGVTPPDHGVDEASTALSEKARGSGPHAPPTASGGVASSGSTGNDARAASSAVATKSQ